MANRRVSVQVSADVSAFNRAMLSGADSAKVFSSRLEDADSRMAAIVQTGLALAPALVPIGAAAIPAIAGLTTQLGFAAVAGGVTMLAFQGVGDALTKLNEFQLAPTSKNLSELNEKLDALGPAGEVFVRQLQEMRSEFQELQNVAQQNMLPGVTEGIESAMEAMPAFERVIASVATAMGGLAADAGASLGSPEWLEFYDYLEREAGPILEQTGKALGNFVEGITNMMMAFDPLSDSFVTGMMDMSEAFVAWSDGLDSSQSFQEFVQYVQESGPQAMDTLGAIAGALIEFVEAAAPVGAVVLPVLEVLADSLAAIADSPAGPVIVGAAAAVGVLGRSLALLKAVGLRGEGESMIGKALGVDTMKSYPAAVRGVTEANNTLISAQGALAAQSVKTRDAQFAMIPTKDKQNAWRDYAKQQTAVREATAGVATAEKERSAAMRGSAGQMGKVAAAAGGLALMSSGVAEGMGLSNTMSMALMGTLAGPFGAAVGGGVGLLLDMKDAANNASVAIDQIVKPESLQDLAGLEQQLAASRKITDDLATPAGFLDFKDFFGDIPGLIDKSVAERQRIEAEGEAWKQSMTTAFTVVGMSFGEDFKDDLGRNVLPTLEELDAAAQRAAPAMRALGISAQDLADMDHAELVETSKAIADWTTNADSAEGRTRNVADAFRELDNSMVETVTSAERVKAALDALLGPGLGLSAATDAWRDGLRNLNEELDKNKGSLFANTDAASQNRGAIRSMVETSASLLEAQAGAGASAGKLSGNLRQQRRALLDAGEAAGVSRKELNNYLDDLGLTPKLVRTLMKLEADEAEGKAERLRERLEKLNAMKPTPKVDAEIAAAEAKLERLLAMLEAASRDRSSTVTTTLRTVRVGSPGPGPQDPSSSAHGNIFAGTRAFAFGDIANAHQPELAGPGVTRVWREPETQGEAYIPLANDSRRPRARSILEDTASMLGARSVEWFADGGSTGKKKKKFKIESDGDPAFLGLGALIKPMIAAANAQAQAGQQAARAAEIGLQAAEDQQKAASDNLNSATSLRDSTKQMSESLASSVSGQFKGSLTGGGLSGLTSTLATNINAGSSMDSTLQALVAAGLDTTGAAAGLFQELAASTDQTTANQLLASGPEMITFLEQQYAAREQVNASRGAFAADASFGALLAQQNAAVVTSQAQLDQATAAAARMDAQLSDANFRLAGLTDAVNQQAAAYAEAMNSVAANASRGVSGGGNSRVGAWR